MSSIKSEFKWEPQRLEILMKKNNVSASDVANGAKVSAQSIKKYLKGAAGFPGMEAIAKLSLYFNVPSDFFLGILDKNVENEMLKGYELSLRSNRRIIYEKLNRKNGTRPVWIKGTEAPYPYNLTDAVFGYDSHEYDVNKKYYMSVPMTKDQEKGLQEALDSLADREKRMVVRYYKDGLTLEQIGKEEGLTKNRIRQIIDKGVRKLRHPSRSYLIRYGYRGCGVLQRENKLRLIEKTLDVKERKIAERKAKCDKETERFPELSTAYNTPLENMELSVRAYNCLKRACLNSAGVIADRYNNNTLHTVRNLGRKSFYEVCQKLAELGFKIELDKYKF